MGKENLRSGIVTIFGNHVSYSELGSNNVSLQATLLTNQELIKKLTGLEDGANVLNAEAIGVLCHKGVKKTFGDVGYYKGFNVAYQPCAQTDGVELAECLEYRINMVKEFVKHADWITKVETFNFKGLDVKIKRVTETSNSFPLRFFIDGVKQSPYWTEFINKLITLSFEDRVKYLTIENSQKDGLSVIVKVGQKKKTFLIHNSTEPEVGEFKETINNVIIPAAEFLEKCLAELKPKQHIFNLSVDSHPVFKPFLVTDGYKTSHYGKREIPEMLRCFFEPAERINPFEHIGEVLSNTQVAILKQIIPTIQNNPFVLDGLGQTIRERDVRIEKLEQQLKLQTSMKQAFKKGFDDITDDIVNLKAKAKRDNIEKAELKVELQKSIERNKDLKDSLLSAVEQLSVYQKREAKIAEVVKLTYKIESFNK